MKKNLNNTGNAKIERMNKSSQEEMRKSGDYNISTGEEMQKE